MKNPQVQYIDTMIVVPVAMQRQAPTIQTVQKTVEVIQLVPQERIQERIAEQVVDIPLPQIMEEMLFSSTYASESYGRTDRGRLHSPDSGGNFRVCVIRHAFHLAQILRAHDTRSQVSSSFEQFVAPSSL